jgi:hypothetical protein
VRGETRTTTFQPGGVVIIPLASRGDRSAVAHSINPRYPTYLEIAQLYLCCRKLLSKLPGNFLASPYRVPASRDNCSRIHPASLSRSGIYPGPTSLHTLHTWDVKFPPSTKKHPYASYADEISLFM